MKRALIFFMAASCCAVGQEAGNVMFQTAGPGVAGWGLIQRISRGVVKGAPYSATITSESTQTLADGNRIVQSSTGTIARDSQGRTRQDAALPAIGNLSAANAPHLVFIQDPVAGTSYTLNLTDKTARKNPTPPAGPDGPASAHTFFVQSPIGEPPMPPPPPPPLDLPKHSPDDPSQVSTEQLGTQTMEGVTVNGVRTTRTIPAGQIGNDRAITIVTEVWTSPDLQTIISSKRSDPRMGEQTFRLTNIQRAEPDSSLFSIPADFKVEDGPRTIIYQRNQ
jgi:hypothetical protein